MFRSLSYYARQTLRSLKRNRWMAFASIATTTVALFILGTFVLGILNVQTATKKIESNLEMVVWLKKDIDRSQIEEIEKYIGNISDVEEVSLVPKEEGIKEMNENYFGEDTDLLTTLGGDNPLPDYLVVKVTSPDLVKNVASQIEKIRQVETVDYGQDYLDKLITFLYWLRVIGLGVVILFLVSIVFLISNTIRLAIYARSKEIAIMKFVGATNWFIRWPFLMEGMILGLTGSIIAAVVLYSGYSILIDNIASFISFIPFVRDTFILRSIIFLLVLSGTLLGGFASLVSLRRYLKI